MNDFLIIFIFSIIPFILGKIFLKKYQIIFEPDRKIIGIYIKKFKYIKYYFMGNYSHFINYYISLIIIILKRYNNKPRKIRANELEEEFIYKENKKEEDKLEIN